MLERSAAGLSEHSYPERVIQNESESMSALEFDNVNKRREISRVCKDAFSNQKPASDCLLGESGREQPVFTLEGHELVLQVRHVIVLEPDHLGLGLHGFGNTMMK
jgi:hypothetical protein